MQSISLKDNHFSEEYIDSIYTVEEWTKEETIQ
jgi:hypothetical protein